MWWGSRKRETVVKRYIDAMNRQSVNDIAVLLADNVRFIDARGDWIEGRPDVLLAAQRLFALDPALRIDVEQMTPHGSFVLLRGQTRGSLEMFNQRMLWRAMVEANHIVSFQSFTSGDPPPLVRMLMGERARSEDFARSA